MSVYHAILFEQQILKNPFQSFTGTRQELLSMIDEMKCALTRSWALRKKSVWGYSENEDDGSSIQRFIAISDNGSELRVGKYIGVIQTPKLRITILPKITQPTEGEELSEKETVSRSTSNLLYLLRYAFEINLPRSSTVTTKYESCHDILEMIIFLFAEHTLLALERNIIKHYDTIEENLHTVKGKILFSHHYHNNILKGKWDKHYCEYDQFQENNLFNRIIKYVSTVLLQTTHSDVNREILRKILTLLPEVQYQVCTAKDCERVVLNHFQREYRPILNYVRMILSQSEMEFVNGRLELFHFFIDMDTLFERFVAGFLKHHFAKDGLKIFSQKSDMFLTEENLFQMKQDIYIEKGKKPFLIIDTKNKWADFQSIDGKCGISQSDLYQMFSYCVRRKAMQGMLLYPKYRNEQISGSKTFSLKDSFSNETIKIKAAKLDLHITSLSMTEKDRFIKEQLLLLII